MTEYRPGDALDRTTILAQIRSPGTPTSVHGALTTLRKWVDLNERARKLGVTWPESYERYSALDGIITAALRCDSMVEFRYDALRLQLGLPDIPTTENIQTVARFAEAELKDMLAHGKGTHAQANAASTTGGKGRPKNEKGTSPTKPDSGKSDIALCRDFQNVEKGCPRGKECKFRHTFIPHGVKRCYICGISTSVHSAADCPRPKGPNAHKGKRQP